MAKEVAQARNAETEGSEHEGQEHTPGPGEQALQALLAKGRPEPKKVVTVLDTYRGERDALMAMLHKQLGNAYVQEVVQEMNGLRVDTKRLEVTAGDPGNPETTSFVANKEGATLHTAGGFDAKAGKDGGSWSTADGDFTGKVDKKGLDSTYKIDDDDAIHAQSNFKDKTATIGWERDGQSQGELYGDWSDKNRVEAGLRREWELDNGSTVEGGIRNVTNKNPHHEVPYLEGTMYGSPSGEREQYLDDLRRNRDKGHSQQVYGAYTKGDTRVDAGVGISGGELAGSANLETKLGQNDALEAGIRHDSTGTTADAKHVHTFGDGGTLTSAGWLHHDAEGTTGQLSTAYKDTNTSLGASYTRGTGYQAFQANGRHQLNKEWELHGAVDHVNIDNGGNQTRGHFGGSYTSPNLVHGFDIDAGRGDRDYLGLRGSVAGQVAPNWYASGFGGSTFEAGKQATAHLGAGLTFTPSQRTALTLAGVMDHDGVLETRLQFDVFKDKVSNVAELSKHQRDALFSLFISYTGGANPSQRILDERFGRPDTGSNQPGSVQAGIRIKF
ncbi:MAG: hypothetical protein SFX73_33060 [Kofleriaceae bacterium]|nr:hypothetical protein [Kofleriaceae bacterium]